MTLVIMAFCYNVFLQDTPGGCSNEDCIVLQYVLKHVQVFIAVAV
jgi:hypothetical protein